MVKETNVRLAITISQVTESKLDHLCYAHQLSKSNLITMLINMYSDHDFWSDPKQIYKYPEVVAHVQNPDN